MSVSLVGGVGEGGMLQLYIYWKDNSPFFL